MKLKTIFKRMVPVLAAIAVVILATSVFILNKQNQKALQTIGSLESEISTLEKEKNEAEDKANKMWESDKICHPGFGHDCVLIRENSNTLIGHYLRTNGDKTYTFRVQFPPSVSWTMLAEETYYAMLKDSDKHIQIDISIPTGGPKPCFFPTKPSTHLTIGLFKKYPAIKTEFGTIRLGWTEEEARDPDPANISFYLCQETKEGNNEWVTETGIGQIQIIFPEENPDLIDPVLQSIKSTRITTYTLRK